MANSWWAYPISGDMQDEPIGKSWSLTGENTGSPQTSWWQKTLPAAITAGGIGATEAIGAQPSSTAGLYGRLANLGIRKSGLGGQEIAEKLNAAQMVGAQGQGERLRAAGDYGAEALVNANIGANRAKLFGDIGSEYKSRSDQLTDQQEAIKAQIDAIDEANREKKRQAWIKGLTGVGLVGAGLLTGDVGTAAMGGSQMVDAGQQGGLFGR